MLLQEKIATVGEIMDAVSSQEINKAEGGTFLVSDTVECKPNIFLTDYITSNESTQAETFYILTLLDEDTVQIYSISRTYDESSVMSIRRRRNRAIC